MATALLESDEHGLYCAAGGFYVDPWSGPVDRAVVTHAHADHAQPVMQRALVAAPGQLVAAARLPGVDVETLAYGERRRIGDVEVSLHPSGHILGSAQVRIERAGEVWVVSGDYKLAPDPTAAAFEPVPCHVFVTEATFGLPIFRWDPSSTTLAQITQWRRALKAEGRAALIFAYALGKAARVLAGLVADDGPVYTHGAVERMLELYRAAGVTLPPTTHLAELQPKRKRKGDDAAAIAPGSVVLAPPLAQNSQWARKLQQRDVATAFCSGWMRIRGVRRRKGVDRGFALSDHADWPSLLHAIEGSRAARVLVTHGYASILARALRERGIDAAPLKTQYVGEDDVQSTPGIANTAPHSASDSGAPGDAEGDVE